MRLFLISFYTYCRYRVGTWIQWWVNLAWWGTAGCALCSAQSHILTGGEYDVGTRDDYEEEKLSCYHSIYSHFRARRDRMLRRKRCSQKCDGKAKGAWNLSYKFHEHPEIRTLVPPPLNQVVLKHKFLVHKKGCLRGSQFPCSWYVSWFTVVALWNKLQLGTEKSLALSTTWRVCSTSRPWLDACDIHSINGRFVAPCQCTSHGFHNTWDMNDKENPHSWAFTTTILNWNNTLNHTSKQHKLDRVCCLRGKKNNIKFLKAQNLLYTQCIVCFVFQTTKNWCVVYFMPLKWCNTT